MSKSMDEFKKYVRGHPSLKNEVIQKKRTWQDIYEEFVLYGETTSDSSATATVVTEKATKTTASKPGQTEEIIKSVLGYVKKIDPDQVTKTVTSIQKVLELLTSFGAGATVSAASKSTLDPLFDKKFDEWY